MQNTNGGSLFAVAGSDQNVEVEEELMQGVMNQWLALELVAKIGGRFTFKVRNIITGATAEFEPNATYSAGQIMNLLFVAEGGGPQKYEFAWWKLDYD